MSEEPIILECLPDEVRATMEARDRALEALGSAAGGMESVIDVLRRWLPGSTIRVAFLGGSPDLHRDIETTVAEISDACNLSFDFGYDSDTETYRSWSTEDVEYAAEIRVSFDRRGNFSLVGTDSISPVIGRPDGPVGGRPGQRTLNLGAFHVQRPASWRGTVLHEFMHSVGFHHAHVNRFGPCQEAFRFEDDPGYIPTRNAEGVFVNDQAGQRPGIYTYLSGARNFWSRATVDANLRPGDEAVVATAFDPRSVMLYRFPAHFYRTPNSGCSPQGNGQQLSDGDREGLRMIYPPQDEEVAAAAGQKEALAAEVGRLVERVSPPPPPDASGAETAMQADSSDLLRGLSVTLRHALP